MSEHYYKKNGVDSIDLYVEHGVDVPKGFSSSIRVHQYGISKSQKTRRFVENYKKNGLTKVQVVYDRGE